MDGYGKYCMKIRISTSRENYYNNSGSQGVTSLTPVIKLSIQRERRNAMIGKHDHGIFYVSRCQRVRALSFNQLSKIAAYAFPRWVGAFNKPI